jgi:hypothetical protein
VRERVVVLRDGCEPVSAASGTPASHLATVQLDVKPAQGLGSTPGVLSYFVEITLSELEDGRYARPPDAMNSLSGALSHMLAAQVLEPRSAHS